MIWENKERDCRWNTNEDKLVGEMGRGTGKEKRAHVWTRGKIRCYVEAKKGSRGVGRAKRICGLERRGK